MNNNCNCDFYIRRIHSISGIVPIGFFLLEHIFSISTVLGGKKAFDSTVAHLAAIPNEVLIPLEILFIAIPFLFHGIYGLLIFNDAKNNATSGYGYARNWQFYFQRITAIIVAAFLVYHVIALRFNKAMFIAAPYDYMHAHLANPAIFAFYAVGLVATIFHFTNGIFTFCITWGITAGPRAQGLVNKAMLGLCALLSVVGLAALTKFL